MNVKHCLTETENYIEKYLPFNTQAIVFKILNQSVVDCDLFNNLVDLQNETK